MTMENTMIKYFTHNQYGDLLIIELDESTHVDSQHFTALSTEQLAFMNAHPEAKPMEILQCHLNAPKTIEEPELTLAEYKNNVKIGISDLSLSTSREKVSDYQFLNAQASLLMEDGNGIYSHAQANEYIQLYNSIGKQCREYYYSFIDKLDNCKTIEEAEQLVDETTKWYDNL